MIPKKIRVGYKDFEIVRDSKYLEKTGHLGTVDHRAFKIFLNKSNEYNKHFEIEILAHEFFHAYMFDHDNELNTEENANTFGYMLMCFAKEMGWLK
jgi:hypothetical protein